MHNQRQIRPNGMISMTLKTESEIQLEMVIYKQSLHYSLCDGEPS
jgi:hypothetical protein